MLDRIMKRIVATMILILLSRYLKQWARNSSH